MPEISEMTHEELVALNQELLQKCTDLTNRVEILSEAFLEHLTKFDDRIDAVFEEFDATIDQKVAAKVAEVTSS
jgi:hypothetical protein